MTELTSETRGLEIFAGHSITPGTRIPPSYIVPFRPRNGDVTMPPAGVPLSPQYHSTVFFRRDSSPSQSLSCPIDRSIAVISAYRSCNTSPRGRVVGLPVLFDVSRTVLFV